MNNTQAEVERKVSEKIEQVRSGELSIFKAFEGPSEELTVTLGKHSLFLNPFYERWLYYDYLHNSWEDLGLKMGEGIIVGYEDTLGFKKLPQSNTEPPESWYLYLHGEKLNGPLKKAEFKELLYSKQLPAETLVFSAAMTAWQRAGSIGLTEVEATAKVGSPVAPSPPPPPVPSPPKPVSPFEEAVARYEILKSEYDRGAISRDQFLQQVNELRFQDASGTWWQIAEDGKGWLRWDGAIWIAVNPDHETAIGIVLKGGVL